MCPSPNWELVPEGPVTPLDLLATGEFAAPSELRRLLTHVRVAGHPADMLYSMEATNTDFKAYQFKPVIKIIESRTGRFGRGRYGPSLPRHQTGLDGRRVGGRGHGTTRRGRKGRGRLLRSHVPGGAVLRTFATLDWSLNVGVPSGTPETRSRDEPPREALRAAFRRAANAGWRLSLRDAPIRLKDAEQTLRSEEQADIDIDLFPEVIAGAYGYARSEERRDGLHLMMDVGAGTVDACLFRLRTKDEVENWPLLEARVERLGTAELHERRIAALRRVDEKEAEKLGRAYDPSTARRRRRRQPTRLMRRTPRSMRWMRGWRWMSPNSPDTS